MFLFFFFGQVQDQLFYLVVSYDIKELQTVLDVLPE